MPADALSMRLASADPAREVEPDREAAEALLERVMSSPLPVAGERRSLRRRGLVLAVACLLALVVAAAALAAAGVISFGSPARSSGSLANPRQGLGALALGTARVLPVATPDPTGGLAWGIRVLSTTRGVGCIEFGRLLDGRLGVTGSDGAFGNDGKFHELPAGGLANGGKCANLDAQGRLFDTVSAFSVPASGWQGQGSCTPPLPTGAPGSCRPADLRDLYYGLLGPEATRLTYQLHGQLRTITPAGPEGAYLIVERHSSGAPSHRRYLGGAIDSIMPLPWSSPIVSITYRDGTVCHIAATQPGTFKGRCTPPGYQPAHAQVLTDAQVAATIHVSVVATRAGDRASRPGSHAIRVSFTARIAVTKASNSYEVVEDTSSPVAVFEETQTDISVGHTVSWLLPAPVAGVYTGKIVLGLRNAPPYPIYTYSPGPLVGRFRIHVR
jgi:hypothetical protein